MDGSRKVDPAWRHANRETSKGKQLVCKYCYPRMQGLTRLREHLAGLQGDVEQVEDNDKDLFDALELSQATYGQELKRARMAGLTQQIQSWKHLMDEEINRLVDKVDILNEEPNQEEDNDDAF
ncbi:putative Zinc finger, BED-type [Corchorus olitorius]|uniref:Zinc finger, BED-type n=1 Tax=Corchorus olitorius TaxID=93759 RepID=A0A1R3I3J0_9ROSI|nr:putative Zinc finger, BED-type [Corchorus olitorius]